MPTLSLISESLRPFLILSSLGMDACVIDAGWLISDSTPPRLSASEKRCVEDKYLTCCFHAVIFQFKTDHAAKVTHLFFGNIMVGMVFKTRPVYLSNFWMISQELCDNLLHFHNVVAF